MLLLKVKWVRLFKIPERRILFTPQTLHRIRHCSPDRLNTQRNRRDQ